MACPLLIVKFDRLLATVVVFENMAVPTCQALAAVVPVARVDASTFTINRNTEPFGNPVKDAFVT